MNRQLFFNNVRASLFGSKLEQGQVDNMTAILNEWTSRGLTDVRWLAYILATVYHETGVVKDGKLERTMAPVEEMGRGAGRPYGKKLKMGGGPGKRIAYTTPDKIYYGRGHTQNTWFENYEKLTKLAKRQGKSNWDFLNKPDLLLEIEPSIWATFEGMTKGLYTGRRLSQHFNATTEDWKGARKIINGVDYADLIAGHAWKFYAALLPAYGAGNATISNQKKTD